MVKKLTPFLLALGLWFAPRISATPSILEFTHNNAWAGPATPATLSWETEGATKVTITDPNGRSLSVQPDSSVTVTAGSTTSTWTLTATDAAGESVSETEQVHGSLPVPAPTPTPTPTPTPKPSPTPAPGASTTPAIVSFGHNNAWASTASPATLSWDTTNATKLTLTDPDGHTISVLADSSVTVTAGATTSTWTLTATGSTGLSVTKTDQVHGSLSGTQLTSVLTPTPTPAPVATPTPPPVTTSPIVTGSIFNSNGSVNQTLYVDYLADWTAANVSQHLGPTFAQLNPNATDTRPTNYMPVSRICSTAYANKVNPFELGPAGGCSPASNYWSETGQVYYVPDAITDPGVDRVQTFAFYNNVFGLSPRLDYASGTPHPDPQTREPTYITMNGGTPIDPVAAVRNYGLLSNEALVIYRDGLLAVTGTQTSRNSFDRPYPGIKFPSNKVPTGIALTTNNEFALITIWDTTALKGQLAVVALEAKFIPFQTWPYMALPNEGSWSDFKLLGYIDLPMAAPSSVAAASNGWWDGPSQTNGEVFSQIDLTNAGTRSGLYSNTDYEWGRVISNKGYAIVASKLDNKVVIVDLSPLFGYIRDSYLSSAASYQSAISTRGDGAGQFPLTFAEKPTIQPKIVWTSTLTAPTAVLAGLTIDRWSPDRYKAYVAQENGTIQILDTSSMMARWSWEPNGAIADIGSFTVGRNPTSMAFARHGESGLPLLNSTTQPDPLNNQFYVACRGDREVDAVITLGGQGSVYRQIRDSRMGDPVAVSVAGRGYIVSVADFNGKSLLSFRVGALVDLSGHVYGCGPTGTATWEFAGSMTFSGHPIAVNTANVN